MKPILGIVLAALFFTSIAWLVGREGNSYRRDLKQRRAGWSPAIETPTPTAGGSVPDLIPTAAARQGPAASPTRRPISPDQPGATAATVETKTAPEKARPHVAPAQAPRDPRRPDLHGLAPESLRAIGAELHKTIKANHALVDDKPETKRLVRLARPLLESPSTADDAPHFHVLATDAVNAFSHVGNHIYVSRGVFALAQTDAELQFVVAHELAHLKLGHASERLEQAARGPGAEAGLVPWLHHVIALGYSDLQEFAADAWAYQALRSAGRSRREALGFLRRYGAYAEDDRLDLGRRPPGSQPGDAHQDLANHFPAHPPVRERVARLAAETAPAK
jgi:predicted Zn-dependent protease